MKKNPFSIYDFLGYVFPGAFALCIVIYLHKMPQSVSFLGFIDFFSKGLDNSTSSGGFDFAIEETVLYILFSYMAGHLIAYLSSLTVEPLSIWWYGYPSSFLMGKTRSFFKVNDDKGRRQKIMVIFWRCVVAIFLFPLTISMLFFGRFLFISSYYIKKLDPYLQASIQYKVRCLTKHLSLPYMWNDDEIDYHRIIYHYVYEVKSAHQVKMDNYVALYDFMRSMTLIMNLTFLYAVYYINTNSVELLWIGVWMLISTMLLSYLFFMAFMKFYRRFTLEVMMCLVTDETINDKNASTTPIIPAGK